MAADPLLRARVQAAIKADKAFASKLSLEDHYALTEELHTHQIELELQNEELRASQQQLVHMRDSYAELYDLAPVAYLTLAGDDTIQQANLTAAALFGKTRGELVGSRWFKFLHHDDQDVWYLYRTKLLDQAPPYDCELRVTAANGVRIVQVATHPMHKAAGVGPTLLVSITDVTERRLAEAERLAARQELAMRLQHEKENVEAELAKSRGSLILSTRLATIGGVAAQMAHELRNPLGSIRNAAFLIRSELPADQHELVSMLQLIDDELATADIIIRNLLSATRPPESNPRLVEVVAQVKNSFARLHANECVVLRLDAPTQPLYINVDPLQLRQLLDNLLSNAKDAVGNSGEVTVHARSHNDVFELRVIDSGPGFRAEIRDSIFEPFFTTKPQGNGLGLAICRQIVEQHGGTICIEDGQSSGATIKVAIPAIPEIGQAVRR